MSIRTITSIIVVTTLVSWGLYDIYALVIGGPKATISVVITDFSYYSPAAPLIAGILIDHWFLPQFKADKLLGRE